MVVGAEGEKGGFRSTEKREWKNSPFFSPISLTLFCRMVIPWYLKGFENSMTCARSGFMVRGATMRSARSRTSSPIRPVHSCLAPERLEEDSSAPYSSKERCREKVKLQ